MLVLAVFVLGAYFSVRGFSKRDATLFSTGMLTLGLLAGTIGTIMWLAINLESAPPQGAVVTVGALFGLAASGAALGLLGLIRKDFLWARAKTPKAGHQEKF
ncbi:MAG: hypothetical protein A3K67_06340 [Euryarchaeota archaeon RBG_16_62_10]|nr:MAG: hypothetical protein A3K67_06340 [Euryarchaeota archaeon RBG_16_62_10]